MIKAPKWQPLSLAPLTLIGALLLTSSGAHAAGAAPTSVFDLTLGEPFVIRECRYEIVESEVGIEGIAVQKRNRGLFGRPERISRTYRYTELKPAKDKCFQRVGPFYTSAPPAGADLPAVTPPNNQKVKLVYSDETRPGIADSEDIWVGIQDSRLTGIRFYFHHRNEWTVLQALQKKYGQSMSGEKFSFQTSLGVVRSFYSTNWNFSNIDVKFLSLDTNQIGYDPQDAPIGDRSEVGSVTIQYRQLERAREEKNRL